VLFFAGQARYTVSPHRDDPLSPFAYDPLNDLSGVLALGLRWNLNFFEKNARAEMARAERIKAEALMNNLLLGLQVEVERTLADLEFYKAEGVLREEASKRARKLFTDSFVAFTLGSIPAKDLLEALGTHAMAQKANWESIYQSNTLQFKWAQVTGLPLEP
jgi:outer membrane protein TolC